MLTSIEGTYRNGQIVLNEVPAQVEDETAVIVTFLHSNGVDLKAQGINSAQAAELRSALVSFEDWNEPEMDVYDDYDAAKADL
jgi:hypothetical protein